MVVDSSAAIAILLKEPGWQVLREALLEAGRAVMSAANLLEADMVMRGRLGEGGSIDLDRLVSEAGIEIVAFDAAQAAIARDAFRRFGKRLHPAGLNFGDCFAYALAKALGEPLLFIGDDFARTDIMPALASQAPGSA